MARHLAKHASDSLRIAVAAQRQALLGVYGREPRPDVLLPMLGATRRTPPTCARSRRSPSASSRPRAGWRTRRRPRRSVRPEGTHTPTSLANRVDAIRRRRPRRTARGGRAHRRAGFDSVPADVGAFVAATELARDTPARAVKVTSFLTKVLGGFSGGTPPLGWRSPRTRGMNELLRRGRSRPRRRRRRDERGADAVGVRRAGADV